MDGAEEREGHGHEENIEEAAKVVGGGTPDDLGWASEMEKEQGSFLEKRSLTEVALAHKLGVSVK
jgi:hypothetical protein